MLGSQSMDVVKLTYDDFEKFPDDGLRHELIDGRHYVSPSPVIRHQRIVMTLGSELHAYFKARPIGEVFASPLDVVLSNHDIVEPDVQVILADQVEILTTKHVRGAPAIVVEVLSPGTRRRDGTLKRDLYARVGVREYWMIDPDQDVVTVHRFAADGATTTVLETGANQELTSPLLPDWSIAVDVLLRRPSV